MSKFAKEYDIKGDKKNSEFFHDYLQKIYDRREKSGLEELVGAMKGVVVQVQTGDLLNYLGELYLMTPYRFKAGYLTPTHKIVILTNQPETPAMFIIEPLTRDFRDEFTDINGLFPRAKEKVQARYLGEIYYTRNLGETVNILQSQEIRFQNPADVRNSFLANKNFRISDISYFTNNIVGYTQSDFSDFASLELGEPFDLSPEEHAKLKTVDELQKKYELDKLLLGVDHLATRVLCGEREDALLELITMTNYYFWGAYSIDEMNSSTNICRNPDIENEMHSPAKVFTANNTPFYTKTIDNLPSPTEDFVRNFGKRMHHVAYSVIDGARPDGVKNIDYVVGKLDSEDIPFLAEVIGECRDFPDLKQIFSKSSHYSILITEYVQRCHGFEGFFTKDNVAFLTQAAGEDEALKTAAVGDA